MLANIVIQELCSVGSIPSFRKQSITTSKLIKVALISRTCVILAMAASCWLFPNHNPGDDVFRFSLRFPSLHNNDNNTCFCLKGQACDPHWKQQHNNTTIQTNHACVDSSLLQGKTTTSAYTAIVYEFLLTPMTRWDSARFLDLATYPARRDPHRYLKKIFPQCIDDNPPNDTAVDEACRELFLPTEQAHAFFPLLPLVIRTIAKALLRIMPTILLPPTFEGVVTLAALIWNLLCFIGASLALYDLTWNLTQQHLKTFIPDTPEQKLAPNYCQQLAYQVFLIFCINPASVFFVAAYSESTFALCNFGGHALFFRLLRRMMMQQVLQQPTASAIRLTTLALWMAASYTRSNGTLNSCWLILLGLGLVCHHYWANASNRRGKAITGLVVCVFLGFVVALPVYWHDSAGYQRHCNIATDGEEDAWLVPQWCHHNNEDNKRFSLYGHIQRQHWNVGLFRYYTWKKIPNFLLAGPILLLGISAVIDWIQSSYCRFLLKQAQPTSGKSTVASIIGWAISSLGASVAFQNGKTQHSDTSPQQTQPSASNMLQQLLMGPIMLGHYAVLASVCTVGLTVAHVEITTRMICSTCPAIYWYMTFCCCSHKEEMGSDDASRLLARRIPLLGRPLVFLYCLLYILAGVVMHPNWLPWT
ncbi:GPI mannosyltransferase 2 [Seminavis robusta]|uniref:GPI mannosyltransferase 2 n=1 Tax=Seminavis robusta TaxID=568900 RepID=A0A9N8EPY1_9STRA|nr:GPI mannosyltransferase 2 [Seminavis robusta]|eukprot:Sro1369_g266930.1 GPI mannosyltransferase 2 (645) ;mRNA; r:15744-17678